KQTVKEKEFNEYTKRLTDAEAEIKVNSDAIEQTVRKTEFDKLNNEVKDNKTKIDQTSEKIEQTATSVEVIGEKTDSLRDEFDNLEFGGRNILKQRNFSLNDQYQIITNTEETSEYDTSIWKSERVGLGMPPIHFKGGKINGEGKDGYYTASIYVKTEDWDASEGEIKLLFYDSTNRKSIKIGYIREPVKNWTRLTVSAYLDDLENRNVDLYFYTPSSIGAVTY